MTTRARSPQMARLRSILMLAGVAGALGDPVTPERDSNQAAAGFIDLAATLGH